MTGRWPVTIFASLLIAGLVFVTYLGRSVLHDLEALSTALHDDISWNMSQLEIETLNLDSAAHDADHGHETGLAEFRKRFDIYYSRVETLTQSTFYQIIQDDPAAQDGLAATTAFIEAVTPIVDGPDPALREALPEIQNRIEELRPKVRALALSGIEVFAEADAANRAEFSQTLVKLAISVLALILSLLLALFVLIKFYRRGQQVAHDNQVVRSRFEAAVSSSLDAVLVVDISGKIIEFNGAAETVFGYSREEALGGDMADMIVPQHMREMHRKGMKRFLETGEKKVIGAGRLRLEGMRKSGEVFPVELSISLSEADGERVFVSFLRDITRELQAEDELRSARDKAQESEKAKSDLLTVMSHEMRTPLNGILGSLSLIDQSALDERQKRHLNSISVSGELLLSHVNDVLDLSSLGSETSAREKDSFNLSEMVAQMTDSLRASAETRGNRLSVELLSDDLKAVWGSKRSLQQCLVNLVGNAIKFTKDGVISIELERLNNSHMVEIRISDTGVGIAPENLDRIFEEFVTIDTAYARKNAGTGLGLAITKRLVEAMEGEIDADSIHNEGSIFTLRIPLPIVRKKKGEHQIRNNDVMPKISSGFRALVVDDNEINRMILADMLGDLGFEVAEAADGFDALRLVANQSFDIGFLDISMPGIDGIETLQRLRKLDVAWNELPVIAVTAHASQKDHANILKESFIGLLVKPVRIDEIEAKISEVLELVQTDEIEATNCTSENQFKKQFGEHKYLAALKAFQAELGEFHTTLSRDDDLSPALRQDAHRLSGSAAVLGEDVVRSHLQEIEHCEEGTWPSLKQQYLVELRHLLEEHL